LSAIPQTASLFTPEAVRERCNALLGLAEQDALPHFACDRARLPEVADYAAAVIRRNYPDLAIPYHSRWRHFTARAIDRLGERLDRADPMERARQRIDLTAVSVLLDAGAGVHWRYREAETGLVLSRSEGLAAASLDAFCSGLFSGDPRWPLRADADGLSRLTDDALAAALQVTPENPLPGIAGRAALLRGVGNRLRVRSEPRIGGLLDGWRSRIEDGALAARELPIAILELTGLCDVWRHPMLDGDGLVPFHKLSQWLSYSLVEVLEQAGIPVAGLDHLTGLAEYRNGGLFVDLGVLRLRDPSLAATPLPVAHPAIVEWRALTVALLDRLAPMLRVRLGRSAAELPLARLLQGGTWDAGRRIARERRADGSPPLVVASDGTVF
jgi:hypothetical protein